MICSLNLFAQNPVNNTAKEVHNKIAAQQIIDVPPSTPVKPFVMPPPKSPQMIGISSSANAYSIIVESSTCLTANQDLNAIMFTARANPAGGIGTSSGNIVTSFSTTTGYTWSSIFATTDTELNRYPSGVIYNPTGNTNIDDAYAVVCGPTTDGFDWLKNFWGSAKLDDTHQNVVYEDYSVFAQDFPRYGMSAPGSGKIHVLGDRYVFTTGIGITTWDYLVMNNGTFNATTNSFDWDRVKIYNAFYNPGGPGARIFVSSYNNAWSPDGSVGYVWALGIDSANPNTSFQPVVFKSVDHGATWNKLPFTNFADIQAINDSIWPVQGDPQLKRAYFRGDIDGVVDNDGELHFVATITGAYSTNPDSLTYIYVAELSHIYHVYTTASGWDAERIGTIYTDYVPSDQSGYGSGADALGWDHRMQMARSSDGTKIFASWVDSDPTQYTTVIAPNINVWGKNLTANTFYPLTDFTTGTLIDGMCYFHYMSDIVLESGADILVPMTVAGLGATPLNPVTHYYLSSIGFGPTIGVREVNKSNPISIIGSYPNPASDITDIRINLGQSSAVSVEVFSMTGQKVLANDYGVVTAGEHKFTLDVENLRSGVYVYVVKAGNETASGKLVRK